MTDALQEGRVRPTFEADRARSDGWTPWFTGASVLIAGLIVLHCVPGLFLDAYRDETAFAANAYRGTDIVSLVIVLPALLWGVVAARGGTPRGRLVWLGALGYIVYQFAYVFAYRWATLFPARLALFSLGAFTLAGGLIATHAREVARSFDDATPVRGVGWFLTVIGAGLGIMEGAQVIAGLITDNAPEIIGLTRHPTSPVHVLDLGFVVPLLLLNGLWLRRQRPWGYVAAPIMAAKAATVGLSLLAGNVVAAVNHGRTDGPLVALWALIGLGGALALAVLLRHVRSQPAHAIS